MYEIRKGGAVLALTDAPNYIRRHPEGFYILCPAAEAEGVAVNGVPYALSAGGMGECEDVILVERDTGAILQESSEASNIVFVTMAEAGDIDDVTAGEHQELFAQWAYPVDYKVGNLRQYLGKLYRCHTAHTSQEAWNPVDSNLWSLTSDPDEEWPAWSQPVGAHDAYASGAKVSHNGKHWKSTASGNIWEPGVYGWEEVADGA